MKYTSGQALLDQVWYLCKHLAWPTGTSIIPANAWVSELLSYRYFGVYARGTVWLVSCDSSGFVPAFRYLRRSRGGRRRACLTTERTGIVTPTTVPPTVTVDDILGKWPLPANATNPIGLPWEIAELADPDALYTAACAWEEHGGYVYDTVDEY